MPPRIESSSGVWLDRVRKLPVYVIGETMLAVVVATVPLAWWVGRRWFGASAGVGAAQQPDYVPLTGEGVSDCVVPMSCAPPVSKAKGTWMRP